MRDFVLLSMEGNFRSYEPSEQNQQIIENIENSMENEMMLVECETSNNEQRAKPITSLLTGGMT